MKGRGERGRDGRRGSYQGGMRGKGGRQSTREKDVVLEEEEGKCQTEGGMAEGKEKRNKYHQDEKKMAKG